MALPCVVNFELSLCERALENAHSHDSGCNPVTHIDTQEREQKKKKKTKEAWAFSSLNFSLLQSQALLTNRGCKRRVSLPLETEKTKQKRLPYNT